MADQELTNDELAIFFDEATGKAVSDVPLGLMERVLADAAKIGSGYVQTVSVETENQSWLKHLFAPIGGAGGAFALGAFASVGFVVGLGDADTLYSLPVMGDILATFTDDLGSISPLDTLDYLMAES